MGQSHSLSSKLVVIGNIGAPFGIKGWLKVFSYTDPQENILNFNKWYLIRSSSNINTLKEKNTPLLEYSPYNIREIKKFQQQFLVLFEGIADRNNAALLTNKKIGINRHDLPELPAGQYYWDDLIGSEVYNLSGEMLGLLDHVFATGANDVLVVNKKNNNNYTTNNTKKYKNNNDSYLIPYKEKEFVVDIDLCNKKLIVNWDL